MSAPARRHTQRFSRRLAAHVLIQAYDRQNCVRGGSPGTRVGPVAVLLDADVWEQVITSLRPLDE